MSDHFVEIITFSPSASYLQEPSGTLSVAFENIKQAQDRRTFHGCSHESQSEAYLITKWGVPASSSQTLTEAVSLYVGSTKGHLRVNFKDDSIEVFRAPVVELVFITLKSGATKESISDHLDILTGQDTSAVLSATWGATNDPETLVMIVGWESKEASAVHSARELPFTHLFRHKAHEEVVKSPTPDIKRLIGEMLELAELKVMHVELAEV